jgi:hypothetical protein
MELSFDGAEISKGSLYLGTGIHTVKVKEVTKGESALKKTPYVEIVVEDSTGATCSQQYYLTTEVKDGGKTSAWNISKSAILTLVMAATGFDEETAKSKLVGMNTTNIDTNLSTLLVGKLFAIKLNGKWVYPTDAAKQPWIKSEFGSYLFAVPANRIAELGTKIVIKGDAPSASNDSLQAETAAPVKSNW